MTLDDAPILTRPQLEAIEYIDSESDHGDVWAKVTHIHRIVLTNLEARGFINLREEDGENWAMPTDDGLLAVTWHIKDGTQEAYIERGYKANRYEKKLLEGQKKHQQQLLAEAADDPEVDIPSESDAKRRVPTYQPEEYLKNAMENLSETQLIALDDVRTAVKERFPNSPRAWIRVAIHHHTRNSLVKYGYLEYDKELELTRLTESGLKKINDEMDEDPDPGFEPEPTMPPWEETGLDNEDSPVEAHVDPTPSPSPVDGEGNCASECDECIHRDVLNLISEKHPKVAELRDVLMQQKRLMKELGLGNG